LNKSLSEELLSCSFFFNKLCGTLSTFDLFLKKKMPSQLPNRIEMTIETLKLVPRTFILKIGDEGCFFQGST